MSSPSRLVIRQIRPVTQALIEARDNLPIGAIRSLNEEGVRQEVSGFAGQARMSWTLVIICLLSRHFGGVSLAAAFGVLFQF
jgi:hypothetical protein